MKLIHKKIGCWTLYVREYKRVTRSEQIALEWVEKNAEKYNCLQLDDMMRNLATHLDLMDLKGVRKTVLVVKSIAGYAGNVASHYGVIVLHSRTRRSVVKVYEPIDTDLMRYALAKDPVKAANYGK